ncbi:MAG: hypothetical protein GC178_16990 [Flavobacteriales bacterium]|nr:hypothetical protein [Flavobacteriales bacterium]
MRSKVTKTLFIVLSVVICSKAGRSQDLAVSGIVSNHNGYAVSCSGADDGSIDLSVSGGSTPYGFLWSTVNGAVAANGATTEDLIGLTAGTYRVIVTDSVGDSDTLDVVLNAPADLSVSLYSPVYNGFNVHCQDGTDGQISSTVSGGVSPYSYAWNTGDAVPNIGGLSQGSYQVVVTGTNGCRDTSTIILVDPSALLTNLEVTQPIACHGGTAVLDLSVSGGVGPYIYNWGNGAITQDLSAAMAGMHSVRVQDANGCVRFDSLLVTEPDVLGFYGSLYEYQPGENFSCDTCNDGQATLTPSGGTSPYTYLWTTITGTGNGQATATAVGLSQGDSYTFTITDAMGCSVTDSFTMPEVTPPPSALELVGTMSSYAGGYQVSGNGVEDGWIDLQVIGGTSPYVYLWSTSNGSTAANGATTQDLNSLGAGTYTVTVTDVSSEQAEKSFTLTAPATTLSGYLNSSGTGCYGTGSGQLSVIAQGGVPPYSYVWSTTDGTASADGATTYDIYGLSPGTYSVTITDASNSTVSLSYQMQEFPEITTSITPSFDVQGYQIRCAGEDTTLLDLQVFGGSGPYSYLWDNGKFTQDIRITTGGWYNVIVTDGNGCTKRDSIFINAPDQVQIDAQWYTYSNGQLFSCDTCNDAQVTVNFSGGVAPYAMTLSSATQTLTGPTFTGIYADTAYTLYMEDAIGCSHEMTGDEALVIPHDGFHSLGVSAQLSQYAGGYNISSYGGNDGWIDLNIYGQMSQETILWSDGNTDKNRVGLTAGTYEVTVSDNAGQSITKSWTLTQPQAGMSVMISGSYGSCMGSGTVNAMVNGGTPPYSYQWTGPSGLLADAWSTVMVYEEGQYDLTVTDANGQTAQATKSLYSSPQLWAEAYSPQLYGNANASCRGGDGSIVVNLHDGAPPYTIDINIGGGGNVTYSGTNASGSGTRSSIRFTTNDTIVVIDTLDAGDYYVNISDMSGCGGQNYSLNLVEPDPLLVSVMPALQPNGYYIGCGTCTDGQAEMQVSNANGNVEYVWAQVPEEYVELRIEGASFFERLNAGDVDPTELFDGGLPFIIGTAAEQGGLSGSVMYAGFARDELGCFGGEEFFLEKPNSCCDGTNTSSSGFACADTNEVIRGRWVNDTSLVHVCSDIQVGIGTDIVPQGYALGVAGKIIAEEVEVQLSTNWPDYVFESEYEKLSLDELRTFISENGHLPDVPSAKEIEENGVSLGEMDAVLLRKIEELTLYMLELKQENEQLKKVVEELNR